MLNNDLGRISILSRPRSSHKCQKSQTKIRIKYSRNDKRQVHRGSDSTQAWPDPRDQIITLAKGISQPE